VEIHGRIHLPLKHPAPATIFSHGLFSNKGGARFVELAQHGDLSETTLTGRCADFAAVADYLGQTAYTGGRSSVSCGGHMGDTMGDPQATEYQQEIQDGCFGGCVSGLNNDKDNSALHDSSLGRRRTGSVDARIQTLRKSCGAERNQNP
jgi:hypothetical protein